MLDSRFVLVTGGAGYIGSQTCKELHASGYTPVVFDNLSSGHRNFVKWGPFFQGDLLNISDLQKVFREYSFEGVMHFAAKAYVGESVQNPIKYFRENIEGTTNLIEVFSQSAVPALVLSSSCATYGEPGIGQVCETSFQDPVNPYGFSKLACEKLIQYMNVGNKFNYAILRYFNAAGADMEGEVGELHRDETHLLPLLLKSALSGSTFNVFGSDFDTDDGTAIRDYIHVEDLARAHVLALKKIFEKQTNLICNLGTGVGISVLDVVNSVKTLFPDLKYEIKPRRSGDPAYLVADNSVAREVLEWSPKLSSIENIVQSAHSWEMSLRNRPEST